MSNHIRFNGTADSDDWLVISNQGTDCFLELLISTADAIDKTKHQKELIDFLRAQRICWKHIRKNHMTYWRTIPMARKKE